MPDYVLSYHDATVIREGPAPDPKRQYLFAMYPHGVYGVFAFCELVLFYYPKDVPIKIPG